MKKHNNWNSFSRGVLAVLLIAAIFCGICGLGATFSHVPWLLIAGGICLLVIIFSIIWGLGYKSRQVSEPVSENPGEEASHSSSTKEKPFDYEKE